MGTSKTETTVKTGDMSERGQSYDNLFQQLLMAQIQEFGNYSIDQQQKTVYKDQGQADQLNAQISDIDKQIASIQSSQSTSSESTRAGAYATTTAQQISQLQARKASLQNQLGNMESSTFTDYNLTKLEDIRVRDAIEKYGENSQQVAQMRAQVKEEEVFKASSQADIEKNYLTNLNKFTRGDFSYTQEQYDQIDKYIAPIKDIINKTTGDLLTQYGQDDQMLRSSLLDLSSQIDQTGFAVSDALQAAQIQIENSGATLMDTLKTVNASSQAKAKFEFDLMSQQADQQSAQQAAQLGLPPGSMAEKVASAKMKTDALKQIELDLANQTAVGTLNIQQGVEEGKKQISLSRVALAQSQGAKKENVAAQGFGLTNLLTQKIDQAIGQQGNALIGTEQQRQQMLMNAAFGGIPQMLQAGQNGMSFLQNSDAAKQSSLASLMGPVAQQLGVEQQRQFAETDTTTKQSKSFLDAFTDILGAGASAVGAGFGIAGAAGGGGGSSGGGGSAPSTFMPTMDYSTYSSANQPTFSLDWQS